MNQTKYQKEVKVLLANLKIPHVEKLCQTTNLLGPYIQIYMYVCILFFQQLTISSFLMRKFPNKEPRAQACRLYQFDRKQAIYQVLTKLHTPTEAGSAVYVAFRWRPCNIIQMYIGPS